MTASLPSPSTALFALSLAAAPLTLGACGSSRYVEPADVPRASLDRLTAEEIKNYPSAMSVEDLLEEHFSGFQLRTRDHRPGANGDVYMLGSLGPLFVVDGVPVEYRGSLGLNPRDIETIEIVKHGASAYYGFRGSAGAILITTKGRSPESK